ncbi:MAG: hypothetical protein ACRC2T_18430, partial [Thermoguttaceae bacterium]
MHEFQLLIENIRTVISFPESSLPGKIQRYARDYAEACTELNRRMQQCIPSIRDGNVAEAVRLAEIPPNLPELYTLLDFPERDEWIDIVSTLAFDIPPAISSDQMRSLNEAYLKCSPLEPLFRWHRLHALNGSSIQSRLAIIRAIKKADPSNPFWSEDQEVFEKARISGLQKEINEATASKNSQAIKSLYNELNQPDWVIAPPKEFTHKLCTAVLDSHAEELRGHFASFDYIRGVKTRDDMQKILLANKMSMPESIAVSIRAAINWLEAMRLQKISQNEYSQCLRDLQEALKDETPQETLERLYYALSQAATKANVDIPEELSELYYAQISSNEVRHSRKYKLLVASII